MKVESHDPRAVGVTITLNPDEARLFLTTLESFGVSENRLKSCGLGEGIVIDACHLFNNIVLKITKVIRPTE